MLLCSYWLRCIADAGPDVQARFKENLQLFFEAVHIQAIHREDGEIPDLESYIDVRRDESGCKPCFDLIEYALGVNLPDFVIEHPVSFLTFMWHITSITDRVMILFAIRSSRRSVRGATTW